MLLAHRIRLVPTADQQDYFLRACGVARFAYNWALAEWERQSKAGGKPSEISLRKTLNAVKDQRFPWMREVTKSAPQQAIKNLGRAYINYHGDVKKCERGEIARSDIRVPKLKKKGVHDAFRTDNGTGKVHRHAVRTEGRRVKLPMIGWVRMREEVRFAGQIRSVTISRRADEWYASFCLEIPYEPDLNVAGMLANRRLSRAIADVGLFEFRRQLVYKAAMASSTVIIADRWFPSSKLCSSCGWKNENLLLNSRMWTCLSCGTCHDRDLNAACNLARYPESSPGAACGADGAGGTDYGAVKPTAWKQEEIQLRTALLSRRRRHQ